MAMTVEKDTLEFSLALTDCANTAYTVDRVYHWDTTWARILDDFVTFLEGAGYTGVRDKISIKYSPFIEDWNGPIHDFPEDIPGTGQ
jgi:hypothetical protein